jgi:hypothetical protein
MIKRNATRVTRNARRRSGYTRKHIKHMFDDIAEYTITNAYDSKYNITYGEMTIDGVKQFGKILDRIRPLHHYPPTQRAFYDLGSGIGKVVTIMASIFPTLHSKGIELVTERYHIATKAQQRIKDASIQKRIHFTNGSFLEQPLSDAAWIFISNLCFSDDINRQISDKLGEELLPHSLVICSRPLYHASLHLLQTVTIPMTWNDKHVVHVYEKRA